MGEVCREIPAHAAEGRRIRVIAGRRIGGDSRPVYRAEVRTESMIWSGAVSHILRQRERGRTTTSQYINGSRAK